MSYFKYESIIDLVFVIKQALRTSYRYECGAHVCSLTWRIRNETMPEKQQNPDMEKHLSLP